MNPRACFPGQKAGPISAALVCLALLLAPLRSQSNSPSRSMPANVVSNRNVAEFVPPKSVFVVPKTPAEGRDPFFPNSMRPYGTSIPVQLPVLTNKVEAPVIVELRLQGISGLPERRLAIINKRTFEVGEEGEVPTSAGRVRIRCLEIGADSVVVQIGQERRELHSKPML
jgi:hypothetical protein